MSLSTGLTAQRPTQECFDTWSEGGAPSKQVVSVGPGDTNTSSRNIYGNIFQGNLVIVDR